MDREDKIFWIWILVVFALGMLWISWLIVHENEIIATHRAKVCEIERQNNMKLDSFCISE